MENFNLDAIIEYKMTPLQAKAYKLGLMWLVLSRKCFPNYRHEKGWSSSCYPKNGDPRNCALFRYCFKAVRETQGLIDDSEYKLYVKSQLDVLRAIDIGGHHPAVEPSILAGDKAWVRWKIWKRQYDKIAKGSSKEDVGLDVTPLADIIKELDTTKAFLVGRFEGIPKEEQVMMGHRDMERWIALGKVSVYYASLSPWVKKYCKTLLTDLELYTKSITPEVIDYFNKQFAYELS